MKINNMFFIAMCGLFISCGAEITTDTSSEVLSDRQIPIGYRLLLFLNTVRSYAWADC